MPKVLFSIGLLLFFLVSCRSQKSTGVNSENIAKIELILQDNCSGQMRNNYWLSRIRKVWRSFLEKLIEPENQEFQYPKSILKKICF